MKPRFGSAMEDLLAKVDHMKRAWSQNNEDHDVYSFPLCNDSHDVLQTYCKSLNASGFSGKISGITKMEVSHLCKAYIRENRETPPAKQPCKVRYLHFWYLNPLMKFLPCSRS